MSQTWIWILWVDWLGTASSWHSMVVLVLTIANRVLPFACMSGFNLLLSSKHVWCAPYCTVLEILFVCLLASFKKCECFYCSGLPRCQSSSLSFWTANWRLVSGRPYKWNQIHHMHIILYNLLQKHHHCAHFLHLLRYVSLWWLHQFHRYCICRHAFHEWYVHDV